MFKRNCSGMNVPNLDFSLQSNQKVRINKN